MEIIDANEHADLLAQAALRYGDGPEHHPHYYLCEQEEGYEANFIVENRGVPGNQGDPGTMRILLGLHDIGLREWMIHAEPLCPVPERAAFLQDAAAWLLAQGAKKVVVEVTPPLRQELIALAKASRKVRVGKIHYELIWPVYDLTAWDGERLGGSAWKDLRYAVNAFRKHHPDHRVIPARDADPQALLRLVRVWKKTRAKRREQTPTAFFENAINTGFRGWDEARVVMVDKKPVALTAGFALHHTKPQYYSAIGIYDQSYTRLGEFANWDDLCNLKAKGYTLVDFGGGDASLNAFKLKFRPARTYITQIFSLLPPLPPKPLRKENVKKDT